MVSTLVLVALAAGGSPTPADELVEARSGSAETADRASTTTSTRPDREWSPSSTTTTPPAVSTEPPTARGSTTAPTTSAPPAPSTTSAPTTTTTTAPPAPVGEPPHISMFGDSTALMSSVGLARYSLLAPTKVVSDGGWSNLGCGLLTDVSRRMGSEVHPVPAHCRNWLGEWQRVSAALPQDVAVIQVGPWEVYDQQLTPGGPFVSIGTNPEVDALLAQRLRAGIEVLLAHHGLVVVLSSPDLDVGRVDGRSPAVPAPESSHSRMERFRQITREVVAGYDRVEILDLAGWLMRHPEERRIRPDGVHFTYSTTNDVALWLVPQLLRMHREHTGTNRSRIRS